MSLSVCVAQINPVVGDCMGNARAIARAARSAHAQGAQLLVTAHMALCGHPCAALLQRAAFLDACGQALDWLAAELADVDLRLCVGHPDAKGRSSCSLLHKGQYVLRAAPPQQPCVFEVHGVRLGVLQGLASAPEAQAAVRAGAQVLLAMLAWPWCMSAQSQRERTGSELARSAGVPLIGAQLLGGQDDVVFDGASFAVQAHGALAGRAAAFEEALWRVDLHLQDARAQLQASSAAPFEVDAHFGLGQHQRRFACAAVWSALVLGLRDYVRKSGFQRVLLGLSGGVDSALVLALAVDALGAQQVRTLMMPSRYTADISVHDAQAMAQRMGVRHECIHIAPLLDAFASALAPQFAGLPEDTTEENIQARVRAVLLMALSNKSGALVLATGNKSELACGYCTLYGDMAGAFAPIKDVYKTQVYALARWRNAHNPCGTCQAPIPQRIIERAPSAELRAHQTDQDSLPPYDVLDAVLVRYIEEDARLADLCGMGLSREALERVARLVRISEYKRQQGAAGVRISARAFGSGWRYPLVNAFGESAV